MKLTCLLTVFFILNASAVSSQTKIPAINLSKAPIEQLFFEIEQQTPVKFLYRNENIDGKFVSIDIEDASVDMVLNSVLSENKLTYKRMENNLIVISPIPDEIAVTGTVKDEFGNPLPGVNIVIKGTINGVISDIDGQYSINVPNENSVLVFSFVGMKTKEMIVGNQTIINIMMQADVFGINEVVVTALGIKREKKTLTYATQEVNMDGLSTIQDVSLGNALSGKIAGVSITSSTGASGVSGDPRIIIRGDRSIQNNNEPLIVIDGIPSGSSGGSLSGINPDDVVSMNVLKGPSASALYGSSANNGVIVITTKSGEKGEPRITVNSVSNFDLPYLYPEFQNEYAQGASGIYQSNAAASSWGPKMTGQSVQNYHGETVALNPQPDNVKDLFSVGYNLTNSFSYSSGSDKSTTYFSYSNTTARGVLEDNKMKRHNFNLRLSAELAKNLDIDFKMTYFRQQLADQPQTGDNQFSPMFQLIKMPRSIRTVDIENASYLNDASEQKQNTWAPTSTGNLNPYWAMEGFEAPSTKNRINSFLKLRYSFTDYLYLQLRGGMNIYNNDQEKKTYWSTPYINAGTGDYYTQFAKSQQLNGDILLAFEKEITSDIKLGLNVGAEINDAQSRSQWATAGGLSTENKFSLDYASNLTSEESESRIQKQSVYAMGQLGYKNFLFLDVTSRNDWSSTLPAPHDYFYPSVGLSGIITEMINLPSVISFAKFRGSYAEVGNDAKYAIIFQDYSSDASGPVGMFKPQSTKVAEQLIPEKTKSLEFGTDLRFLDNRLGIDFTWYKSNTYNQLLSVTTAPTSGYSRAWINAGNIQNKGVEIMLYASPIRSTVLNWDISLNFAKNNNEVIELTELLDEYEISSPNLSIGETWAIEGRPFGEIYTYGFVRNDKGEVIVDANGLPEIMTDADLYLGNFNYDWRSGLTSNLRYKNWNMSLLIDLNYGGVRQSASEAWMDLCGTSVSSLEGREEGLVVDGVKEVTDSEGNVTGYTENDIVVSAENYFMTIGGRINDGSGELYNHEATNSRLREFSLGYTFPLKSPTIKSLRISAVGRNLFYIYNGCDWFDPDVTYDIGDNGQGAESSFLPGTRTLGFNIKVTL